MQSVATRGRRFRGQQKAEKCPRLDSLPSELLLNICGYLDHQPFLINLSLCNHRLYEVVQRCLYSSLPSTNRIFALLRTLLKRPHLGEYVKTMTLQTEICHPYDRTLPAKEDRYANKITPKERRALWNKPDFTWSSWEQQDLSFLDKRALDLARMGTDDGAIAYLLCQLPNLQSFTLFHAGWNREGSWSRPYGPYPILDSILTRAVKLQEAGQFSSPASLANLREVVIIGNPFVFDPITGFNDITGFLALKSVRSLVCERILKEFDQYPEYDDESDGDDFDDCFVNLNPRETLFNHSDFESNVTHLTMRDFISNPRSLGQFLRRFPRSKKFVSRTDITCDKRRSNLIS